MWFKRTDKMFEEAAQDPERLEKLITLYRRTRTTQMMGLYGSLLLLLGYGVWLVGKIYPVLKTFLFPGTQPRFNALLTIPLEVSTNTLRFGFYAELTLVAFAVVSLFSAVLTDIQLKNLLLFRAWRERGAAWAKSGESAQGDSVA